MPARRIVFFALITCCGSFRALAGPAEPTIDRAEMLVLGPLPIYDPESRSLLKLLLFPQHHAFYLNDGSLWEGSAGAGFVRPAKVESLEMTPNLIRYTLNVPVGEYIYGRSVYGSYGSGHVAEAILDSTALLVLEAIPGSTTATMTGFAKLRPNGVHGTPIINVFSAEIGDLIPFSITYILQDATWDEHTFETEFQYNVVSTLDFANAIPEPTSILLLAPGLFLLRCRAARHFVVVTPRR